MCVMGGKGGCTSLQVLGGGAGVRAAVERDIRDMLEMQPGDWRPPSRDSVGLPRPTASELRSSSSMTSSSMATLQ